MSSSFLIGIPYDLGVKGIESPFGWSFAPGCGSALLKGSSVHDGFGDGNFFHPRHSS